MGRDKSALTINGTTFVDHQCATLALAGCGPVLVSVAAPGERPDRELVDDRPGTGPLAGWCALARRFAGEGAISLPVDMPGITVEIIRDLMASPPGTRARSGGDDHWLLARLGPDDLASCMEFAADGGRSARDFWKTRSGAVARTFDVEDAFLNVNGPADLERLNGV